MDKVLRRLTAGLIDYILFSIIYFFIWITLICFFEIGNVINVIEYGWFATLIAFQYICDTLFQGRTIGKRLMHIRLRSDNNSFFMAFHSLMKMFNLMVWPYSLARAISKKVINGDKTLNIITVNTRASFPIKLICKRLIAQLIDVWVFGFLGTATVAIFCVAFQSDNKHINLLIFVCAVAYFVLFNTLADMFNDGETIGMRVMRLHIAKVEGFDKKLFILHGLAKCASTILFVYSVPFLILKEYAPYDRIFSVSVTEYAELPFV